MPRCAAVIASAAMLLLTSGCWEANSSGGPAISAASTLGSTPPIVRTTISMRAPSTGPLPSVRAPLSSTRVMATSEPNRTNSAVSAAIPTCGVYSSSQVLDPATVTAAAQLAPDTCSFAPGLIPSPGCSGTPLTVISAGVTQPSRRDKAPKTVDGGGGRWGGRNGSAICFGSYTDHSVWLSNGGQVVLVEAPRMPLIYAARTELQRSPAVWGAVSIDVASVIVRDATRPQGVCANLSGRDPAIAASTPSAYFFIQPVGAGPITVTASNAAGETLDTNIIS